MTRDDIIRMAREAGLPDSIAAHPGVQQLVRSAVAAEREACAKECEAKHANGNHKHDTREDCAAAIRTRGVT